MELRCVKGMCGLKNLGFKGLTVYANFHCLKNSKSSFPNKLAGTVKTETFCSVLSFTETHECKMQQTEYCVGDKVVFAEQKCNFQ